MAAAVADAGAYFCLVGAEVVPVSIEALGSCGDAVESPGLALPLHERHRARATVDYETRIASFPWVWVVPSAVSASDAWANSKVAWMGTLTVPSASRPAR